ncbi:unnamed protein product [Periconia digitata]|uniref:Uncharacterized protein n=1 Tax=Periconia digitata TaxID=1303443 RepID=A0A9W4UPW5_9PLEO|nr:unnamed protein product [Periconia digitata]
MEYTGYRQRHCDLLQSDPRTIFGCYGVLRSGSWRPKSCRAMACTPGIFATPIEPRFGPFLFSLSRRISIKNARSIVDSMPEGRTKMQNTAKAQAEAKRICNHDDYLRRRCRSCKRAACLDFIHFETAPLARCSTNISTNSGHHVTANILTPQSHII